MIETVLDLQGLRCPLPVLKTNRALHKLETGTRLRVLATDRNAIKDFQEFCRQTGHSLIAFSDDGTRLSFLIKRK